MRAGVEVGVRDGLMVLEGVRSGVVMVLEGVRVGVGVVLTEGLRVSPSPRGRVARTDGDEEMPVEALRARRVGVTEVD